MEKKNLLYIKNLVQVQSHSLVGHFIFGIIFNEALQYLSIGLDCVLLSSAHEFNKDRIFSQEVKSICIECEHCTKSININLLASKNDMVEIEFLCDVLPLCIITAHFGLCHLGNMDAFEKFCTYDKTIPNHVK